MRKIRKNRKKAYEIYIGMKISQKNANINKFYQLIKIFADLKLKDKKLITKYKPAYKFLSEWMPKLNTASELLKQGEYYEKTGSFKPAHPLLLVWLTILELWTWWKYWMI